MEFMGLFLPFAIPTVAVGILAFIIIAIVQEARTGGKAEAVRGAFTYVVSLVMLFIVTGAIFFLLQQVAREAIFTSAKSTTYTPAPPALFLSTATSGSSLYVCTDSCQFNDTDRELLQSWKTQYADWKKTTPTTVGYTNDDKRQTVNAISFLIVALPLWWWFFRRMANRDARRAQKEGATKPSSLRSAYFYIVAFSGLVGLVTAGALLLNVGLKSVLGIQSETTTTPRLAEPTKVGVSSSEQYGVKSIINCAEKCGFSADDKALAEQWIGDYDAWNDANVTTFPAQPSTPTDLANYLPLLLVSWPLFWYHFMTIRRESAEQKTTPAAPPGASA